MKVHIGIVGDFSADFEPHVVTNDFLGHAVTWSGFEVRYKWVETDRLTRRTLEEFDALWISPGSPYRDVEGALTAIQFARETGLPLGGACAGFQHVVLEYARNVLGFCDAAHAEYDPPVGSRLILDRLACPVAGKELPVKLKPGSLVANIYASTSIIERYYCSFGLNPEYCHQLKDLQVTGWDDMDEAARVVELPGHPYYLATLFVPKSTPSSPHPLATAFLKAAFQQMTTRRTA